MFYFVILGDVAFSDYFLVPFSLSLCMESTSYVLSFRMVFFYLVTMCWIFDINLCENSIKFNQSWRVPGTSYVFFLPDGVLLPCDHGLFF